MARKKRAPLCAGPKDRDLRKAERRAVQKTSSATWRQENGTAIPLSPIASTQTIKTGASQSDGRERFQRQAPCLEGSLLGRMVDTLTKKRKENSNRDERYCFLKDKGSGAQIDDASDAQDRHVDPLRGGVKCLLFSSSPLKSVLETVHSDVR